MGEEAEEGSSQKRRELVRDPVKLIIFLWLTVAALLAFWGFMLFTPLIFS